MRTVGDHYLINVGRALIEIYGTQGAEIREI